MNPQTLRVVAAAVILWAVFGGGIPSGPSLSAPYAGPMGSLHSASRSMAPKDREELSAALAAGGDALAADSRGLVSTTAAAQRYVAALLEFSYNGMGKPSSKYPAVAEALSAEMRKTVGEVDQSLDAAGRARLAEALREAGRAAK